MNILKNHGALSYAYIAGNSTAVLCKMSLKQQQKVGRAIADPAC